MKTLIAILVVLTATWAAAANSSPIAAVKRLMKR